MSRARWTASLPLTSSLTGVMLLKRRQPDEPAAALNKFCSIYTLNEVYTEFGIEILSTFFAYPPEIRKIIYTTNIIEGLNRQFRQITKNKPSFTNDDSLRKMLYLASRKIVEHWTARCRNWDMVLAQLNVMFQDRQSAWSDPARRISGQRMRYSRCARIPHTSTRKLGRQGPLRHRSLHRKTRFLKLFLDKMDFYLHKILWVALVFFKPSLPVRFWFLQSNGILKFCNCHLSRCRSNSDTKIICENTRRD